MGPIIEFFFVHFYTPKSLDLESFWQIFFIMIKKSQMSLNTNNLGFSMSNIFFSLSSVKFYLCKEYSCIWSLQCSGPLWWGRSSLGVLILLGKFPENIVPGIDWAICHQSAVFFYPTAYLEQLRRFWRLKSVSTWPCQQTAWRCADKSYTAKLWICNIIMVLTSNVNILLSMSAVIHVMAACSPSNCQAAKPVQAGIS